MHEMACFANSVICAVQNHRDYLLDLQARGGGSDGIYSNSCIAQDMREFMQYTVTNVALGYLDDGTKSCECK